MDLPEDLALLYEQEWQLWTELQDPATLVSDRFARLHKKTTRAIECHPVHTTDLQKEYLARELTDLKYGGSTCFSCVHNSERFLFPYTALATIIDDRRKLTLAELQSDWCTVEWQKLFPVHDIKSIELYIGGMKVREEFTSRYSRGVQQRIDDILSKKSDDIFCCKELSYSELSSSTLCPQYHPDRLTTTITDSMQQSLQERIAALVLTQARAEKV